MKNQTLLIALAINIFLIYIFQKIIYKKCEIDITETEIIFEYASNNNEVNNAALYLENRFVSVNYKECNGLGKMMYRAASLCGIAGTINRTPYLHNDSICMRKMKSELETIFPNFFEFIKLKTTNYSDYTLASFTQENLYEEPKKLMNISTTFLEITGRNLPSYRYFDEYKNSVGQMFAISDDLTTKSEEYANSFLPRDTHVLCIHTRRGNYIDSKTYLESRKEFVEPAAEFAVNHIKNEFNITSITLVLIGDDENFKNTLNLDKFNFLKLKYSSKGETMALAVQYCDSILLTASGSTSGWWMSYLNLNAGLIFFNAQMKKNHKHISVKEEIDVFPEDWIMLALNKTDGKVYRKERTI